MTYTYVQLDDYQTADALSETFFGLSDASRIRIMNVILVKPAIPRDIISALDIKPSSATHHLDHLLKAGLVGRKAVGKCIYYYINDDGLVKMLDLIQNFRERAKEQILILNNFIGVK